MKHRSLEMSVPQGRVNSGRSGEASRGPGWTFKKRIGDELRVLRSGRDRPHRCKTRGNFGKQRRRPHDMVGNKMLSRFAGVVPMITAIVMMMMPFTLPMHYGMRHVSQKIRRHSRA